MNLKCLPYNLQGSVVISAVQAITVSPMNRAVLPYPPGKLRVQGQYWPNGAHLGAVDVTLTWAHRRRTLQSGYAIVPQDADSVGTPEGSYTVEVLIAGTVKRTQTGITGTSFTYTLAQRTADDADLTKQVQFRITPVNGSLTGTARVTDPFMMA